MKNILILIFSFLAITTIYAQDPTPDKFTGVAYFSGQPGIVPNVEEGYTVAFNTTSQTWWYWNEGTNVWTEIVSGGGGTAGKCDSIITTQPGDTSLVVLNCYDGGAIIDRDTILFPEIQTGNQTFVRDVVSAGAFTVTAHRLGADPITLTNPSGGTYNITVPAGTYIGDMTLFGNNGTLDGALDLYVNIIAEDNISFRRYSVQLYDNTTGSLVDQHQVGSNHVQNTSGTTTSFIIPGLAFFGPNGYFIELR